jgi:hypothetical protein
MVRHCAILFRCAAVIANLGLPTLAQIKSSLSFAVTIELTEVQT